MVGCVWSARREGKIMSIRRDPRTGRWYFRARVTYSDGTRDRVFGTPGVPGLYHEIPNTKVGAQEAERRAITKAMTGQELRPTAPEEVPTIRQYVDPFMDGYAAAHKPSSRRDKRQRLDLDILPVVGDLRLDALRQEHVDKIVANMLDRDRGRKGINTTTSVLSSLIGYAVTNKVIDDPKLTFTIMAQDTELQAVAPSDVDKLADAANARYRVAILLGSEAGLRIGEARALPWIEVNEIGRELTIAWSYDRTNALSETKGWERRTVPISAKLWSALQAVDRVGPLVFSRLDGKPLGYDVVRDVAHEIYDRAKVKPPKMPWHALRHTYGTTLANTGAPIQTIRELMGHKSIETTMRYLHSSRDDKRAAIAKLDRAGSQRAAEQKQLAKDLK